jgi:hypothetical protein
VNWWLVVGVVAVVFALLVARGMWVIGTGSDAEHDARDRLDGTVGESGWNTLDWLRTAEHLPGVSWLEEKLDRGDDDD